MKLLLIDPIRKIPVASIQQNEQGRTLKLIDDKFKRKLEINGITLSKDIHGVWRVFPDGDPQVFLNAFEHDLYNHGLLQKGYYWCTPEEYEARDSKESIQELVKLVLQSK